MNTSTTKIYDKFHCGMCSELFSGDKDPNNPRKLLCGHSFCYKCLEILLKKSALCPCYSCLEKFLKYDSSVCSVCQINGNKDDLVIPSNQSSLRPFKFEDFCDEHRNFKEIKCLDCSTWNCAMCIALNHKQCKTMLVQEEKREICLLVQNKLQKRNDKIIESIYILEKEEKGLELMLENIRNRISDLHNTKSDVTFFGKLKNLQTLVENSSNEREFIQYKYELNAFLDQERKCIQPPSFKIIVEEAYSGSAEVVEANSGAAEVVEANSGAAEVVEAYSGAAEVVEANSGAAEVVDANSGATEVIEMDKYKDKRKRKRMREQSSESSNSLTSPTSPRAVAVKRTKLMLPVPIVTNLLLPTPIVTNSEEKSKVAERNDTSTNCSQSESDRFPTSNIYEDGFDEYILGNAEDIARLTQMPDIEIQKEILKRIRNRKSHESTKLGIQKKASNRNPLEVSKKRPFKRSKKVKEKMSDPIAKACKPSVKKKRRRQNEWSIEDMMGGAVWGLGSL